MEKNMLKKISEYGKLLVKTSMWHNSREPFGHIENATTDYEFFCYLKLLENLSINYDIKFIKGNGNFPQKPAKKANKPKFILLKKNTNFEIFQMCAGIKISAPQWGSDYTISPDISIQKPNASDEPNQNDVVIIFDSKYRTNNINKINISILREFAKIIDELNIGNPSKNTLKFSGKFKKFCGNGIITNGLSHQGKYAKQNKIIQVEKFDVNENFVVVK